MLKQFNLKLKHFKIQINPAVLQNCLFKGEITNESMVYKEWGVCLWKDFG